MSHIEIPCCDRSVICGILLMFIDNVISASLQQEGTYGALIEGALQKWEIHLESIMDPQLVVETMKNQEILGNFAVGSVSATSLIYRRPLLFIGDVTSASATLFLFTLSVCQQHADH